MATARTKGRKYPRLAKWDDRRSAAFARAGSNCEISGAPIVFVTQEVDRENASITRKTTFKRAADHLFPERFLRRFFVGCDPHILENLYVITPALHAQKTAVETLVYKGDLVGYTRELIRLGWTREQIDKALKAIWATVPESKK
jgi:hypothetical protein